MEEATIEIQQTSPELEAAVVEFLIRFWIEQGITEDKATIAAQKALVRLRANMSDETWCLCKPPQISTSPE